ncbi:MAG: hypothetical protein ACR2HY_06870 [Acidimicrobiales bacterium]
MTDLTKEQKVITGVVLAILVLAIGYTLIPFRFADAVNCGPPLLGAKPGHYEEKGTGFIKPDRDCRNAARSRLAVAGVTAILAMGVGVASLASKNISTSCLNGDHEDCTEWWTAELGEGGEGYSCQCSCHRT